MRQELSAVTRNVIAMHASTIAPECEIWKALTRPEVMRSNPRDIRGGAETRYQSQIKAFVARGEPIEFVLIAFPFKAWRNPLKTNRRTPDLGEFAFLGRMLHIDCLVRERYAPGTSWTILTEGECYHELFGVPAPEADTYLAGVKRFVAELNAEHLFHFVSLKSVLEAFPEFPRRVAERETILRGETRKVGHRFDSFFGTFLTSQDVRAIPRETLLKIYRPKGGTMFFGEERVIKATLEERAREMMIRYLAINEAKNLVGARGAIADTFPEHLYVSVTTKPSRYAFHAIHPMARFLPHHGVPVVQWQEGRVDIKWLHDMQSSFSTVPESIRPVYIENDTEPLPFYYEELR